MNFGEDTWPEDEASIQAESWRNLCEDYPDDSADNEMRFRKDCARMERFFAPEKDGADLISRFRAAILQKTGMSLA